MIGGHWTGVTGAADALVGIATQCARDEVVAEAMMKVFRPIVAEMAARAPRRPPAPDMAESLAVARVQDSGTPEGVVVVELGPKQGAPHAYLVRFWEFGTSRNAARPFMRPTWDEYESTFSASVTAALQKAYATVAKRFANREARKAS